MAESLPFIRSGLRKKGFGGQFILFIKPDNAIQLKFASGLKLERNLAGIW